MDCYLESGDHYHFVKISKLTDISKFDRQRLKRELEKPEKDNNAVILSFADSLQPDDNFFALIDDLAELFYEMGRQWVLIPPFKEAYPEIEARGIQFAPSFQEAVDMAFMLKIEQDFLNDEDEENQE